MEDGISGQMEDQNFSTSTPAATTTAISSEMEQDECHHHRGDGGSSSGGSNRSSASGRGRGCLGYPVNDDPMPGPYNKLTCESSSTYLPVNIQRPVFQQLDLYTKFNQDYEHDSSETVCCYGLRRQMKLVGKFCEDWRFVNFAKQKFPIFDWLPKYKWRDDLASDLIAGFTVAVMHVPQGMAYALLAEVPPIVGIYMAFFPIFVYVLMGCSRHVSMGTFAVICLMTGKVVNTIIHHSDHDPSEYSPIQVATIVSFVVGICQLAMGILHLGVVSLLLSPSLVGGFTTGAAFHVLTSQVRNFFGISTLPRRAGMFKIPMIYYDIATHISDTNTTTIIVSAVTILVLAIFNEIIKPFISKRTKIPIPIEFLAVITGTLVSWYLDLHGNYGVAIIENIPTGLPTPTLPPFELIPEILMDGAVIAFVSYAISISMAKVFAKRNHYTVDPDQELLAQGSSNICGSFFSCAPVAVSLSRSLVQEVVGGKTQLTSLFSCVFLLFVLLWIGPLFEALPSCVLAGIIVVALKGMFLQAAEFPRFWRMSTLHGLIWMLSFLVTVLLDIAYGLAVGIFMSTVTLLWRSNRSEISILGSYANSDLYIDIQCNPSVKELPGIKIIKYTGSLNFATIEKFMENVANVVDIQSIVATRMTGKNNSLKKAQSMGSTIAIIHGEGNNAFSIENICPIHSVILDFSSASSVGPGSVKELSQLHSCFGKEGIEIYYAGCPVLVIQEMEECGMLHKVGRGVLFPTVHDAVLACQSNKSHNQYVSDNSDDNREFGNSKDTS